MLDAEFGDQEVRRFWSCVTLHSATGVTSSL
jgi:hypothetical protein